MRKLWEIQGSQRLTLNTTISICCSPLTFWRCCFSLNFSPLPTVTFKAYALSCCYLFPSSSPIRFAAIVSPSCFLQFLILSESLSLLLLTLLASYLQGWRLIKKPGSRKSQPATGGIWDGEPRVSRGWSRSPPPTRIKATSL